MRVQDQKRLSRRVLKPCVLLLALLPYLTAYARGDAITARFDIPQQRLDAALSEYARQSGQQLLYAPDLAVGKTGRAVRGEKPALQALDELLAGTGLKYSTSASGAILINGSAGGHSASGDAKPPADAVPPGNAEGTADTQPAADSQAEPQTAPDSTATAKAQAATNLDTIVVTAQKRVERIQDVPIAISAFSGDDLGDRKIETGGDLVTATPNVAFSKTNFASYNFQIRGIGTQALSVTTDPAVAISFNSTPMIRNRLFEQEYFDVDRVEVLRGPQGTLYGRNATAGVVNMIPKLADPSAYESWFKVEAGNFDSKRFSGMVNLPINDALAFRMAGAWTDRSGYIENTATGRDVDDRSLWSTRASVVFKPSDATNLSLVWEHFDEDDRRARTGKQLCHTDPGASDVDGIPPNSFDRNFMSQGCADGSLYDRGAFGLPNGGSLPWVLASGTFPGTLASALDPDGNFVGPIYLIPPGVNPYEGRTQSTDLRQIETTYDPRFQAKNDVVQFNFDTELNENLKFVSQTLYTRDKYYSTQDYNRFQSNAVFTDTDPLVQITPDGNLAPAYPLAPKGVLCDPQLGCSDRMLGVDLVDSYSKQWSQEFRLQSMSEGPFNFSIGANYLYYSVDESYYVFNNVFTAIARNFNNTAGVGLGSGNTPVDCPQGNGGATVNGLSGYPCVYIDPNSLDSIDGQGHNYFRSRNVAKTKSAALFGEAYWQLSDTVKLTAGLRLTRDTKITTPYPSQTLLSSTKSGPPYYSFVGAGFVNSGYPALPDVRQTWNEPTGRLVLDWKPDLPFTDSTLVYLSGSRGYKAGGTNSPAIGADPEFLSFTQRDLGFDAEFVNAFELGMKNVMADGKLNLNATVFYNDYRGYQVSQIQDRATFNENFDAKTWGAEIELAWRPTPSFQLSGNVGFLRTRLNDNQYSIDVMNRTQGNPDWVVLRPWVQQASNCIAPRDKVAQVMALIYAGGDVTSNAGIILNSFCSLNYPVAVGGFTPGGSWGDAFGFFYDPRTDAPNGGQGFAANVGGNELPNAPHITASLSPQYTFFTAHGDFTVRADLYYQGASWARIYQDEIDRLHDWGNVNLSLTWQKPEADLTVQLYVKNLLDGKAITGTFLNSDDSGLTANVFTQDPRIIGISLRKGFF